MCNQCDRDPRDDLIEVEMALFGVVQLLSESGGGGDDRGTAAILRIIHARMEPAVQRMAEYVPKGHSLS